MRADERRDEYKTANRILGRRHRSPESSRRVCGAKKGGRAQARSMTIRSNVEWARRGAGSSTRPPYDAERRFGLSFVTERMRANSGRVRGGDLIELARNPTKSVRYSGVACALRMAARHVRRAAGW